MKQLIYASTASELLTPANTETLAEHAARNNAALGITGVLLFSASYFLQVLEGDASAVNRLYNAITHDPRHRRVELLAYVGARHRQFARWSMAFVPLIPADLVPASDEGDSPNAVWNPYALDAADLQLLLAKVAGRLALSRVAQDPAPPHSRIMRA